MSKHQNNTGRRSTSDAIEIIDAMIGDDPRAREVADKALEDALVGQMIYDIRTQAGLTQKQLAELAGTDQAVISRLEDADYEGHTMSMLRRIAKALGKRVEVRFVDAA
jgi:ribosome-binding protein aMBF1 (putative translation factor)|tara:strand:- start:2076 stop:2399 length:324 start_codon:yes stop_codon:yes gene_type:complete